MPNNTTPARLSWAIVLAIFSIPTLATGLIDPLEGLAALVIGIILIVMARVLSRVKYPRLGLSSLVLASMLMAVILVLALASNVPSIATATPTADNSIALGVVLLLWLQRAVTLLMVIGLIMYVVRIVRARRALVGTSSEKPASEK